jgi:hypothetical protein
MMGCPVIQLSSCPVLVLPDNRTTGQPDNE